jgi:hypothetical protein
MAAAPRIADMIGGQGQLPKTDPANVSAWDIASFAWIRVRSASGADKSFEADVSPALEDFGDEGIPDVFLKQSDVHPWAVTQGEWFGVGHVVNAALFGRVRQWRVGGLAPQHLLNFLPEPHGHGSFRPTLVDRNWVWRDRGGGPSRQ